MHFDEIRQFKWILRLKMSKICIENTYFNINLVLDTIFRTSKSLELTFNNSFTFIIQNRLNQINFINAEILKIK